MELMKILSDPRRTQILALASGEPVTVKELAEKIGEEPLRLYYHVKKLVKAELLEIVETKQQGNLIEKYYKSVDMSNTIYKGDIEEQSEHIELALSLIHQKLNPGLKLYQKSLELIRERKENGERFTKLPFHVSIDSTSHQKTARQWRESLGPILNAMDGEQREWPEIPQDARDDEKGTYQYVLISYCVEDATKLGLVDESEKEQ
ncbi:helix-turn-helix transcriptional regulator [Bacillus sp. BGMRC 2118]|nr:helix-turn-helix transcriptional regulator [Bacillus sp. BGMRC 2118]